MTTLTQPTTLTPAAPVPKPPRARPQTLWGLDWFDLHARFWASKGVQLIRPGERSALVQHAELYMLLDTHTLTIFRPAPVLDTVSWLNPELIVLRVQERAAQPYREQIVTDGQDNFQRFQRLYKGTQVRTGRVVLTPSKDLAAVWQESADPHAAWKKLRSLTRRNDRYAARVRGKLFDGDDAEDLARFGHELVTRWQRPDSTIPRVRRVAPGIWADQAANVTLGPGVKGPLWIGAGRTVTEQTSAVGPAVLWDDAQSRPAEEAIDWQDVESLSSPAPAALLARSVNEDTRKRPFKRLFDVAFASAAILGTFPIYPLVALAILIEDGTPIFFRHRRETLGGKEFGCLKFRSMRKDSEEIKAKLMAMNQADGPQFFIKNDPRLTKVGAFIREYQIDELPQLFNILKGDMSVVGPRPSPYKENQYCPPWREARLSVRPGLTGLWQISRTREEGNDFQEWIKYDIQYVERQSFWLDLWIIWRTIMLLVNRATKS